MRTILTAAVAAVFAVLLVWQHLHGGVPAHHLLAQQSLPSVSNWWGLAALPALTWYALGRMERRRAAASTTNQTFAAGFGLALLFGAVLSVSFTLGQHGLIDAMLPVLGLVALAYPMYRAECFLGFVLGMTYTFGPILPIMAATVFALAGAALHHVPRLIWAAASGLRRRPS